MTQSLEMMPDMGRQTLVDTSSFSTDNDNDNDIVSTPDRKFACGKCNHVFTRKHNLKSHLLIHTQKKPFSCETCSQTFRRHHDLKRHEKLHTGEKPHRCFKCGKQFARADALVRHNNAPTGCSISSPLVEHAVSPPASNPGKRKMYETNQWKITKNPHISPHSEPAASKNIGEPSSILSGAFTPLGAVQQQQRMQYEQEVIRWESLSKHELVTTMMSMQAMINMMDKRLTDLEMQVKRG